MQSLRFMRASILPTAGRVADQLVTEGFTTDEYKVTAGKLARWTSFFDPGVYESRGDSLLATNNGFGKSTPNAFPPCW
jgi:hypothetical protein